MLKVSFVMLEISYIKHAKFTLDDEGGTFWLHNQLIGFIFLQWKCFLSFWQWEKNIDVERIFVSSEPHKAEFSRFPDLSLLPLICSFRACRRGAILLGQVIPQASVVTLKCDLFQVTAVTGFFSSVRH